VSELRRFQNARRNDKKKYRTDIEAMLHAFLTSSTSSSMENSPLPIGQKKKPSEAHGPPKGDANRNKAGSVGMT